MEDRRLGKRILPSDYYASAEKSDDLNFHVHPWFSKNQEEEAALLSYFSHQINTSNSNSNSNKTLSVPIPHGRLLSTTSGLIEMQEPSQLPIQKGISILHLLFLIYINNHVM